MTFKLYVQFTDTSEKAVQTSFSCAQDPDVWPNQGEIDSTDARWTVFYDSLNPIVQTGLPAPTTE